MPHRLSRRHFLQTTAAGAALGLTARLGADEKKPAANERLHVAVVGFRSQGASDLHAVAAGGAEIVALCDVATKDPDIGKIREQYPKATFDTDFRKTLDRNGIDAVVVGTPDHWHALITLAALRAGKHVYCEKPLTHTVQEARVVAETAAKYKRVTQMGTQIHGGDNYRRAVELVQSGAIGPVREVHVWCGRSWGGTGQKPPEPPVPEGLDYQMWVGPAPFRPYSPAWVPYEWRRFWDFGGGTMADMGCHYMDLAFWALKLRHPTHVAARGTPAPADGQTAAGALEVEYEFPARGELPPVKLTWYDGGKRPKYFAEGKLPRWGDGVVFVGSKGMLLADYTRRKLLPEKEYADFTPPKPFIPNSIGHYKEWVEACKSGGPTTCNFDYAGALTEAVLLGNVSYRCGQPLKWDARNLKADVPEAEKFLRKEYRRPWSL
jgi:predicted dehydrogenase